MGKFLMALLACGALAATGVQKKASLNLQLRDKIVASQARELWVRLELRNTGADPIRYIENLSFFKTCAPSDRVRIVITEVGGKKVEQARIGEPEEPSAEPQAASGVDVVLAPGETLAASKDFCRFDLASMNLRPGRYKIWAVIDDEAPGPVTDEDIRRLGLNREALAQAQARMKADSLGRLESSPVTFRVR